MYNVIYTDSFIDGDRKITVKVARVDREKASHARAYVSNWSDDVSPQDTLGGFAKALGLDTIYTERGKYPAMDAAWDAHNSIVIESKTADMKAALAWIASGMSMPSIAEVKPVFSRKAGCACGCSPGFILKGLDASYRVDVTSERGQLAAKYAAEDERDGVAVGLESANC